MAQTTTMDNSVNRQLLFDFRKTFPEIPESVVVATLQQYQNNRDICYDVLKAERQKYLYGPFESGTGPVVNQVRALRLKDEKGRGLSQPHIEPRPPDPAFATEYSYSQGMSHSRSEPHLLQETCHSPTHLGRPPEYSSNPVYYTDYTLAMRQHPAPPPPTIPYSNSGNMNMSQDARFPFVQQHQPPYSMTMMLPGYNSNGANFTYATAGASNAHNPGMKQDWTNAATRVGADPQRSSSPFVNYQTHGSPYTTPPRQDGNYRETRTNSAPARPQPNLPPLYIDTNNPHPPRQLLNMTNSLYGSHSPHNSRSQSPVVHNPMQMTLPQQPPPYQNHHGQGVHTPGSEPGTPPAHFPHTNSAPNVFFQHSTPNRLQSSDSDQSLLETSDPHELLVHQQPIQPAIISRSSSQSSLANNDFEGRSSRSNSACSSDDIAYTQALILHQKARKAKLEKEAERYRAFRDQLRTDVWAMENEIAKSKSKDFRTTLKPDDLVQMREANRRLQIDIQLLYRELDSYDQGQQQPPVNENFYMNMDSTGQSGTLRPPPNGVIESLQSVPRLPIHPQEQTTNDEEQWACSACTFLNHPALDKCECCEFPRAMPHRQGHG